MGKKKKKIPEVLPVWEMCNYDLLFLLLPRPQSNDLKLE